MRAFFLFSGDIAVENLDDAIDVGNQILLFATLPVLGSRSQNDAGVSLHCSKMIQTRIDQR